MKVWAYIATTAGAPMSTTLALAEGTALLRYRNDSHENTNMTVPRETLGLIHRSHYSGGREVPHINELKVGDEIVLMYDFMDTGLVYPLARFKILDPNDIANQYPLKNMDLDPRTYRDDRVPPLIELKRSELLQPDYIGNIDNGPNNNKKTKRHLALIVRQLSAGPPKNAIGKVFLRDPDPEKRHNTILPWVDVEGELDEEYDAEFKDTAKRKEQLEWLVPDDIDIINKLEEKLGKQVWRNGLDGRGKQLLINAKHLLNTVPESNYDNAFSNSTLSGYCLIALVEYEMLRLLKKMADIKLEPHKKKDTWIVDDLCLVTGKNSYTRLPLAPEGVDDHCSFGYQLCAISLIARDPRGKKLIVPLSQDMTTTTWVRKWKDASQPIKRARNRIAHSYYLQKVHFDELWKLVCGEDGILKLLHG